MKIILILFIILLTGCTKENIKYKEMVVEYGSKISLQEIETSQIITPKINIETTELGTKSIIYKTKENNNIITNNLKINIVDTTKPVLEVSSTYYTEIGKKFDLKNKLFFGDNYDRNLKLEIIGNYDINKIGTYPITLKVTDSSGNYIEKETKIVVRNKQNITPTIPSYYKFDDFKKEYKNNNTMVGIDVSVWQGDINFKKVKEAGAEFVMIRIGFGHDSKNNIVIDSKFKNNIKSAKEEGLLVGIYFYSYAKTIDEAKKQASWIIQELNGINLDLPITFDWESWTYFDDYQLNFLDINNIAKAFMDECIKAGYDSMLYSSLNYLNKVWNLKEYKTWLAHYTKKTTYENDYLIWQNSSTGSINGINGAVDLDVLYKK